MPSLRKGQSKKAELPLRRNVILGEALGFAELLRETFIQRIVPVSW